jgi:hypothetical protein
VHEKEISEKTQRMYMYTEGHRWSDRVESPTEILQRERLGGVALARNYTYPGHAVSWQFRQPDAGTKVAILVEDVARDHFKVVAYNTTSVPQHAVMTTWNVISGAWTMKQALAAEGTAHANNAALKHRIELGRSLSTDVEFAPNATTVLELALDKADAIQPEQRADLGIGIDDVHLSGNQVIVTVHSLGAVSTAKGMAALQDDSGHVYTSVSIPALPAPRDLRPQVASVKLTLPSKVHREALSVRIQQSDDSKEVTLMNNCVRLSDLAR